MSIDLFREPLLTLSEAGELVGVHPTSLWRWSARGKPIRKGSQERIFLEVAYWNGTLRTTRGALDRFCQALSLARRPGRIRSPAARRRACAAAMKRLEASGA